MRLATHKKFKGGRLMPWGKGTVVTGAKGYVFLSGNTATGEDYDPLQRRGGAIGDPAMQWRAVFADIKSDLEELGSSLEHLVKLTFHVRGPFLAGGGALWVTNRYVARNNSLDWSKLPAIRGRVAQSSLARMSCTARL